jgi:uncharacterized RDD family membrane protein YckC
MLASPELAAAAAPKAAADPRSFAPELSKKEITWATGAADRMALVPASPAVGQSVFTPELIDEFNWKAAAIAPIAAAAPAEPVAPIAAAFAIAKPPVVAATEPRIEPVHEGWDERAFLRDRVIAPEPVKGGLFDNEPATAVQSNGIGIYEISNTDWWEAARREDPSIGDGIEMVEAAHPIHGNLVEVPRELVATRKARPRRAEGPLAGTTAQLRIYEVESASAAIADASLDVRHDVRLDSRLDSRLDAVLDVRPDSGVAPSVATAIGDAWRAVRLEAEEPSPAVMQAVRAERAVEQQAAQNPTALEHAAWSRRLLAAVVDASLVVGAFVSAAFLGVSRTPVLPSIPSLEIGGGLALVLVTALYLALFFTLGKATPGMRYARLALWTLGNEKPSWSQRCRRLGGLLLSLAPAGLGVFWALFDQERLGWHDRLSGTYLRKA